MRIYTALATAIFALGISSGASAQTEITLLSPNPIKETVDRLIANFQTKTGDHVKITYGTGVGTRQMVAKGGAQDVTLLFAPFDDAIRTGNVDRGSAAVVARLRLAIAVKKGAPKPDISNLAAVRNTLRNAKSIASVDPEQGSVGGAVLLALNKMGVTNDIRPKIKWMPGGGDVQNSVAKGESEIAFGPYLSDMRNTGIDVVGALPPAAATPVDITGFLSTSVKDRNAARALLDYLRSAEAAPEWRAAKAFPVQ
jgi:ABC-type molybdate transport system substrate-binding protein